MNPTKTSKGNFLRGRFIAIGDPSGMVPSRNPCNLGETAVGFAYSFEHLVEAVEEGREAFRTWKRKSYTERCNYIKKYRTELSTHRDRLAFGIANEVGKPYWEAQREIDETLALIDFFTSLKSPDIETGDATKEGMVRHFPRGVAAVLTPSVEPVFVSHSYFIPALLFGNTLVLKASRACPWVGQIQAEIFEATEFPIGVVSLVQGDGEAARRLVSHPHVDAVFFAGHFETAQKIRAQCVTDHWKVIVTETGGKNSHLIWEDAPYEKALYESLVAAFLTTGQRCTSLNRILVHEKIFDRFVDDFHKLAKMAKIDHPHAEPQPFYGPLLSEALMESFLRFQGIAQREGCEEVMRGKALERETPGYYVSPSIHLVTHADSKSVYQKSEIFGPDVAIFRIKNLEEAIEVLNLNTHGLVGSVYTHSREVFQPVFEEGVAGTLYWNLPTTTRNYRLPVGGLRKSGNSRPMGANALYQCTYPTGSLESQSELNRNELPATTPQL